MTIQNELLGSALSFPMTMHVTLHKWFWFFLLRFYSKVIHIHFYYNVLFIWKISYWKIYKINARFNFQNSWQEKWCCKTSAMEYCTFIDNVHKNKNLCSNYGALRWRKTKIFHSVYLLNDLFPPMIQCALCHLLDNTYMVLFTQI